MPIRHEPLPHWSSNRHPLKEVLLAAAQQKAYPTDDEIAAMSGGAANAATIKLAVHRVAQAERHEVDAVIENYMQLIGPRMENRPPGIPLPVESLDDAAARMFEEF